MPKRRTRRPSRTIPNQRRPSRLEAAPTAPTPPPEEAKAFDLADPLWNFIQPLIGRAGDPEFRQWLERAAVVGALDALLTWVGPGQALDGGMLSGDDHDAALAAVGVTGPADEAQRDRGWLLTGACVNTSVLEADGGVLRVGPNAGLWGSGDAVTRTVMRGLVAVGVLEASVRVLPGRSYRGEQVSVVLAAAVAAAVSSDPWRLDDIASRCNNPFALLIVDEVRRRLVELQALGLLSIGEVLTAPLGGEAVVQSAARALVETPVPAPRHPDTRVKGPTYEVEATVDVGGERRTRVVLIGGGSTVNLLTDVLTTAFGLRDETRTTQVLGLQLMPSWGTPGLLTRAGADRDDPWTIGVGAADEGEAYDGRSAAAVSPDVTVQSLVEHLGERWELPVELWDDDGDDGDDEVLLQLRVRRTHTAEDSRDLVFPACVAGSGPPLAAQRDEATDAAGADLDLEALDALVARLHRGGRPSAVTDPSR